MDVHKLLLRENKARSLRVAIKNHVTLLKAPGTSLEVQRTATLIATLKKQLFK